MTIKAGPYAFRHVDFDAQSDVLYAAIDGPRAGTGEDTPEHHVWRFDQAGDFYGITFISPRAELEREGRVRVTLPSGKRVTVEGIDAVLKQAA